MKAFRILGAALLIASTVSGWDVSKRCEDYPDLCLLSFIWCDYKGHCSLPPNTYPKDITSNTEYPLILSHTNYTIRWQAKNQTNVPIRLRWRLDNLIWETNVTGTEFIFNADAILSSFPTPQSPDASVADAWFSASRSPSNIISIGRADRNASTAESIADSSQQFIVQSLWMEDYLATQVKIEYSKWKFGVGLGVGLGVPFLLAITVLITWLVCKKTMKRPGEKHVETTP
ncbi:hypothetical protein O1611_g1018 [Lasiodiplodia mahajangana]|uniref:Uncharacterized protein n=1 Tax=Lasiodiplodia mahajangana TaxID=1108764 RepID=A0ACC2JYQ3_9PEZI|nr:hypothetical protein O1611_g1018 [Lasiodiplodia mahajangana]